MNAAGSAPLKAEPQLSPHAQGVAYFSLGEFPGEFFRCLPYRATIAPGACGKRWRAAQTATGYAVDKFSNCRDCRIGAAHAGEDHVSYSFYFETMICPRCRRGCTKMVAGTRCVSCYNREREFLSGKNSKGTVPVMARPLHRREIRYTVPEEGLGLEPVPRVYVAEHSADILELVLGVLRTTKGSIMFGFHRSGPQEVAA
jgi:hypothetical protein